MNAPLTSVCRAAALLAALVVLPAPSAGAQQQKQGPVTPPPAREVKRIDRDAPPEPPPIPAEEIIARFVQNEDAIKKAHDLHSYRLSVRIQEFPAIGDPAEMSLTSEIYLKADGNRYGRVLEESPGSLRFFDFFREDLQELAAMPLFALTSDALARYDLVYAGAQPVDELNTYAFRVTPRRLERRIPQFEGVVWVDDRDFAIVKTFGRWVTEIAPDAEKMPFTMFETYREFVAGKYWFPTFIRSEETVRNDRGQARLRLTIRFSDFVIAPPRP